VPETDELYRRRIKTAAAQQGFRYATGNTIDEATGATLDHVGVRYGVNRDGGRMIQADDGGPAFPHANPGYDGNWDKRRQIGGMSLRDCFASQTVAVILGLRPDESMAEVASAAYDMADAMIEARKR